MTTATTTLPPPPDLLEYVNRHPGRIAPGAFPRILNRELLPLLALPLTSLQFRIVFLLLTLSRGASRMQAAADSCEGHDAFENAADDFGCEAVAVEAWQIAQMLGPVRGVSDADRQQVRRALRELTTAGVVRCHVKGTGGRGFSREAQVLSVSLDPGTWWESDLGRKK